MQTGHAMTKEERMFRATENSRERSRRENQRRKQELWDWPRALQCINTRLRLKGASREGGKSVCTVKSSFRVGCLLTSRCISPTPPSSVCDLLLQLVHSEISPLADAAELLGRPCERNVSRWAMRSHGGRDFQLTLAVKTCTHSHTSKKHTQTHASTLCFVAYHRVWFPNKNQSHGCVFNKEPVETSPFHPPHPPPRSPSASCPLLQLCGLSQWRKPAIMILVNVPL